MWIKRQELEELKRRLKALEDRPLQEHFVIYDPKQLQHAALYSYGYPLRHQSIPVQTVVQRILAKLGMRLEYVEGQPARVDVLGGDEKP